MHSNGIRHTGNKKDHPDSSEQDQDDPSCKLSANLYDFFLPLLCVR
jgi:hypothetical protein